MSQSKSLMSNIGFQVVIAMIVGTAVGAMIDQSATIFAPLGAIFIYLIKMLVIPLVAVALISGAAGLDNSSNAGKVGVATLGYFGLTSALAVALALFMGEVFEPGLGIDVSGVEGMFSSEYAAKGELPTFWATVTGMIPTNVFQSLNEANILQILVFCLFFGIALSKQAKVNALVLIALTGVKSEVKQSFIIFTADKTSRLMSQLSTYASELNSFNRSEITS